MQSEPPAGPRFRIGRNAILLLVFALCAVLLIVLRTQGILVPPTQQPGGLFAGNPNEPSNQPTDEDKSAVLKILSDQEAAWNRGDLEAFMAGYWKSAELTFYSGRDKQRGWQKTYDRYKERYQGEGKEMGKLAFTELQVEQIAAGAAIVRGRWQLEKKKESADGLFTLIVKKLPEGWRIVHDHTSAGEPPAKKPKP